MIDLISNKENQMDSLNLTSSFKPYKNELPTHRRSKTNMKHQQVFSQQLTISISQQRRSNQEDASSKQNTYNFQFLVDAWRHHNMADYSQSSEQTIDRLNKTILSMKQGVESCMVMQSQENLGVSRHVLKKSAEYLNISQQLETARKHLMELSAEYASKMCEHEQQKRKLKQKNQYLKDQIYHLECKNKLLQQTQMYLETTINQLTVQIAQQQNRIQQLKVNKQISKKYISRQLDENGTPFFEVYLKTKLACSRVKQNQKFQSFYVKKTLEEIQEFLQSQSASERKSNQQILATLKENAQPLQNRSSSTSLKDEKCRLRASIAQQPQNYNQLHFASTKKQKPQKMRYLFPCTKPPSKQSLSFFSSAQQLRFVRRK